MARSLRTGPRDRDMKPDAKTRDLLKVWRGALGGAFDYQITNRLFMVPHLIGVWGTYKGLRVHVFITL